MPAITYHPFDGSGPHRFWAMSAPWDSLVEWLVAEDGDPDRYALVEMLDADDNCVEVVFEDGKPIGVLDDARIGEADLARYETLDQREIREGREEAARESYYDMLREERWLRKARAI